VSLILDALKKSEQERQREKAPGLQSIHQPVARRVSRTNRGLWLVAGVILVINIAAWVFWRWQQPAVVNGEAPVSAVTPTSSSVTASRQAAPPQAEKAPTVNDGPSAEFAQISPATNPSEEISTAPSTQPIHEVGELPDDVRNNLPAMTFSFHVYSTNPQQRTIIINNRRMREGEEISAGVQLQEITEDGVILGYQQYRVHISVLSGW
jgi:general secretion pathway protein B